MDIKNLRLLSQGNTAEVYQIDENKVLKLFRKGIPPILCNNEFEKTKAVSEIIDNSPQVYETVNIDGRDGIIIERIKGINMVEVMLKNIFKLKKQAKNLAKIHVDIQKETDKDIPTVKSVLLQNINMAKELTNTEKAKLADYLQKLPDGSALCHFDFHPGNVIISAGKPIVIDWMTAAKGDPFSDAARTGVLLKYGVMMTANPVVKAIVHSFQNIIYKLYIKEYQSLTKADIKDIDRWELPVAAARLIEWIDVKERVFLVDFVRNKLNEL